MIIRPATLREVREAVEAADRERRVGKVELRQADAGGELAARKIGGYAATFDNPAEIGGYFVEKIARGAFANAIRNNDVRALFNHDDNYVLGRTSARTLTLSEDATGLAWECDPPDTAWARDLKVSIDRGDITECSFQFRPVRQEWDYSGDLPMRTLLDVELYDVSVVTFPAYDDTSVALRSMEQGRPIPPIGAAAQARLQRKRAFLDRFTNPAA